MIRRLAALLALLPSLAGAQAIRYTPPTVNEIASYSVNCVPKGTSSTGLACGQLVDNGTSVSPATTGVTPLGTTGKRFSAAYLGGATLTTSAPSIDIDQIWNNGAVTFTGIKLNISTDTASASGSLLMDLQVGSASKFSVSKVGTVTAGGGIFAAQYIGATSKSQWSIPANGQMNAVNWTETENAAVRFSRIVEVVTTTKSPSALENGEIYTNTGDADGSAITLLNDPTIGSTNGALVVEAQTVTIAPNTGETILYNGTDYSTGCTCATAGSAAQWVAATGGSGAKWIFTTNECGTGKWSCS